MRFRSATVSIAALLMLATAQAQKVCGTLEDIPFPGVDAGGNIDRDHTGNGSLKLCVSTGSGRFKQTGEGVVPNDSVKNQKFVDPPGFLIFDPRVPPKKILYKVKAAGLFKYSASFKLFDDQINDVLRAIAEL